jgi:hypothetical protein
MKATYGQIEYMHSDPVCRRSCAKAEDGIWSLAAEDSAIRVGPLRIDRESLPLPGKFLIRHGAMPTQSRGHGTRRKKVRVALTGFGRVGTITPRPNRPLRSLRPSGQNPSAVRQGGVKPPSGSPFLLREGGRGVRFSPEVQSSTRHARRLPAGRFAFADRPKDRPPIATADSGWQRSRSVGISDTLAVAQSSARPAALPVPRWGFTFDASRCQPIDATSFLGIIGHFFLSRSNSVIATACLVAGRRVMVKTNIFTRP